jgi:hypothetical protein
VHRSILTIMYKGYDTFVLCKASRISYGVFGLMDDEGCDRVIPFFMVFDSETILSVKQSGISSSSKKSWMSSSFTTAITHGDL